MKKRYLFVGAFWLLLPGCTDTRQRDDMPGVPGRLQVEGVLGTTDGQGSADGFAKAETPRTFVFPEDHGAHPRYRSEWWYLTFDLRSDRDRRFGVQFTVFRQALGPPQHVERGTASGDDWRSGQVYMAHVAITDVASNEHHEWQRLARGRAELAGVTAAPFAVWLENWRLESAGTAFFPLRLDVAADGAVFELKIEENKPVVLQGESGLSRKGEGQASYYYSYPRLTVEGTVTLDGTATPVRGLGWFDREWSTSVLSAAHIGWDWFALHLEDGSDVMAFQLRRRDGERDRFDAGTWIAPDGSVEPLVSTDFVLTPIRHWHDEHGIAWPVEWRMEGARWPEPWIVAAVLDDQRMDTAIRYWEGLVDVRDERANKLGGGYMELTGYSR